MHLRKRTKRKLLSFVLVALIFGAVLVSTDHIKLPIGLTDGTNGPPSLHIGNTTAYFIDVGQGDSILIVTGDNRTVLIDAGGSTSASVVVSFIQNLSIGVIDAFVLTHPDADHIGWSDEVLEAFDVLAIYHSGFVKDTATYNRFEQAAKAEGCPIYTDEHLDPGDYLPLNSSVLFQVMHIDAEARDANSASIVLKMSCGTVDFLFTGDIDSKVESSIVSSFGAAVDIEVLKVAHHGSRYSSSEQFLSATSPEIAVISAGAGNTYGHPHEEALERLEASGATIYRTDMNGTMVITTDGVDWSVIT